jgi:hypothetical protein
MLFLIFVLKRIFIINKIIFNIHRYILPKKKNKFILKLNFLKNLYNNKLKKIIKLSFIYKKKKLLIIVNIITNIKQYLIYAFIFKYFAILYLLI